MTSEKNTRCSWQRLASGFAVIVLGVTLELFSGKCGWAQDRSSGASVPAAAQLPQNHRELIAAYMHPRVRPVIRDAIISKPYAKFGGIFRGGTVPAVCVTIFRDNPFGIVVQDNYALTIENGRVMELGYGLDECPGLSSFTELKKRRGL